MSVSILLITHGKIGQSILEAAKETLGELPLQTQAIAIDHRHCNIESLVTELRHSAHAIDEDDGVLILTDIFGATPCNLAQQLQEDEQIQIVAGLNLPMLLRVMNYCYLSLPELANIAYDGGRNGICCAQIPAGDQHADSKN